MPLNKETKPNLIHIICTVIWFKLFQSNSNNFQLYGFKKLFLFNNNNNNNNDDDKFDHATARIRPGECDA